MTHPLIESLQALVTQAEAVPQEEAYLAELTTRLEQVADERSRCIERLALGNAAAQKLMAAQSYVETLLAPALSFPPAVLEPARQFESSTMAFVAASDRFAHTSAQLALIVPPNSESISEFAALLEPHETGPATEPESVAAALSAEIAPPEEPAVAVDPPSNSESISEPELAGGPAITPADLNIVTLPDAAPPLQEVLPSEAVDDPERSADEEAEAPLTIPERILSALVGGRQRTSRQLADELGLPVGNISGQLSKMLTSGRVKNDGTYPPKYRLPDTVKQAAPEGKAQPVPPQEPPALVTPPAPQAARDREDRQAIRKGQQATTFDPPPHKPSKPVTDRDEEAVLGALLARTNRSGSAALLSGKAAMSTERVKEVLAHLAAAGRVLAPAEGEFQWRLA